jgi:hypothetical protein
MHWVDTSIKVLKGAVGIKYWRKMCTVVSERCQ